MKKKTISLRVDEEIYNYAKTKIPNISEAFEQFLLILTNNATEDQIQLETQLHNINQELKQKQYEKAMVETKIKLLTENYDKNKAEKEIIWSKMRQEIMQRSKDKKWRYMNQDIVKQAEDKLGYDWRTLIKIHQYVQRNLLNFDFPQEYANYWEYIEPAWRDNQ